jgi:murein DD-endopeptidase MepM/ murein hydrolase activator NlpD
MRLDVTAIRDGLSGRRAAWVAAGLAVVASGGAIAALASGRAAAEKEAAWYRQRLAEKRALVRALQSDLAVVAQTTERVSQMAVIAREQNVEVRRLASVEEPRAVNYSPERIAALDDVARTRSDYAARALAQLGFLEEQLASTTDSLSLMAALAQGPRVEPQTSSATPAASKKAKAATPDAEAVEAAVPAGWPVAGEVSSGFGWRESPYGGGSQRHTGLDIRADFGTPVRVNAPGVVVFAGRDSGGYGKTVVIDHGRNLKTLYGHLSGIYVHEGQHLPRGTAIGAVGSTGRATGVHLHYEVRVGNVPVDPMLYIARAQKGGVVLAGYRRTR